MLTDRGNASFAWSGPGCTARHRFDGLIVVGISAVAVHAMSTGQGAFLPVLVVITLVGFVATAAAARFIERTDGVDQRPGDAR